MVATIIYARYSGREWRTMRRETGIAKEAADAAKISAEASVASVRAWIVWAGNVGLMPMQSREETPRYDFRIINVGPAINPFTATQFQRRLPPPNKQVIPDFARCQSNCDEPFGGRRPHRPVLQLNLEGSIRQTNPLF
jgi:hypothetical protein